MASMAALTIEAKVVLKNQAAIDKFSKAIEKIDYLIEWCPLAESELSEIKGLLEESLDGFNLETETKS